MRHAAGSSRRCSGEEYEEGGFIIPIFNNLLDAYAANVQGLEARPNVLNLDHFGRGFKNIWLADLSWIVDGRHERARRRTSMGIVKFVVRRLLFGVLTLFIVSVVVFVLTQALEDPARAILGREAHPGVGRGQAAGARPRPAAGQRSTGTG